MKEHRITYNKHCEQCGIEYQAGLMSSRFCSSRCRAANWRSERSSPAPERERQVDRLESAEQESEVSANGLSAETEFLLDFLKDRAEYWEGVYMDEREVSKEWKEKYESTATELQEQVLNQQLLNHQIEILQKAKSSGMNGLAENPLLLKLAEQFGPALAGLVTRLSDGGVNSKAKQTNLRPDESSSHYIQLPKSLPEDRRIKIIEILGDMAALNLRDLDVIVDSISKALQARRRVNTDNQSGK